VLGLYSRPTGKLAGCLVQDPAAEIADEVRLLGGGDEVVGLDHAVSGPVPAQQRLVPIDVAGGDLDDGLVVEYELALV
jgi:hypothetical protein